jgi:acetate kinase
VHLKGDVDAIVFSAGIGENSSIIRGLALDGLEVRSPAGLHAALQRHSVRLDVL